MTKKRVRVFGVLLLTTSLSGCLLPLAIANGVIQGGGLIMTGVNKLKNAEDKAENKKEKKHADSRPDETNSETTKEEETK